MGEDVLEGALRKHALRLVVGQAQPRQRGDDDAERLRRSGVGGERGSLEPIRTHEPRVGGIGHALTAGIGVHDLGAVPTVPAREHDAVAGPATLQREHAARVSLRDPRVEGVEGKPGFHAGRLRDWVGPRIEAAADAAGPVEFEVGAAENDVGRRVDGLRVTGREVVFGDDAVAEIAALLLPRCGEAVAPEPRAATREIEFVADGGAPRLGALIEELALRLPLHVGQADEGVGASDVGQQRARQAAGGDDRVAVGEVGAGQHGIGIADGVGIGLREPAEIVRTRIAELDVHRADALIDEDGGERVIVVRAAAGPGQVGVGGKRLSPKRIVDRAAGRRGGGADRLEKSRGLRAREIGAQVGAGRRKSKRLRADLRGIDGLQRVDDAQQRRRGIGGGLERIGGARRTVQHPTRIAEVRVWEIARRHLLPHHALHAGTHLCGLERLPRRRDCDALGLELLELEPAAAILPHGVGAEGELVLDERKREVGLTAFFREAADEELDGLLAAVEHGALGVEVERTARPARAVEDGVGAAADVGPIDVEAVVGEDAAALDHVGQIVARDDGLGEATDGGAHVPRLREVAGVGAVVVGTRGELQHVGDVLRADVVEEFAREHGNRGGRVKERRVHARARERIRRAIALVALSRDEERRELHRVGGGRTRRLGGKRNRGQPKNKANGHGRSQTEGETPVMGHGKIG